MNTEERNMDLTDRLLAKLIEDAGGYQFSSVPDTIGEKKAAIRSLMNIRMPKEVSEKLLAVQDAYLQEELAEKTVVSAFDIPTIKEAYGSTNPYADKIVLRQGDITGIRIGAIVNAANSRMLGCFVPCHRCIDNAIHSAAGMQLRAECDHIMSKRRMHYGRQYTEPTGTATLTKAYNLPCDYVIHTVGPIVYGELNEALCKELQSCYESVLLCCMENGISSVAFCCISTGEFHFPPDAAAKIALQTVTDFLKINGDCMERIVFNVFKDSDLEIYRSLVSKA